MMNFISYTQNDDYDEYKGENWEFEAEFSEFYAKSHSGAMIAKIECKEDLKKSMI